MPESNKQTHYDRLHNLTFETGPQWQITFNDSQNVTGGIDTIAFDKFSRIRTFTIHMTSSSASLLDFFSQEISLMEKDSAVTILSTGQHHFNNQSSPYVLTRMAGEFSVNNVFVYTKHEDNILIIQLSIGAGEHISKVCDLVGILKSITFNAKPMGA